MTPNSAQQHCDHQCQAKEKNFQFYNAKGLYLEGTKAGGKMKIIASIEGPDVIEKILKHLGLDKASQARNRSSPLGLFDHPT